MLRGSESKGPVTVYKPDKCFRGYSLFCVQFRPSAARNGQQDRMLLIDMEGNPVHEWPIHTSAHLLELAADGSLYHSTGDKSNIARAGLYKVAPDGSVLWKYPCRIDHDHHLMDSGHFMIHCLLDKVVPRLGHGLRCNPYIIEIAPDKELVWEWHGEEHVQELVDMCGLEVPIDWPQRVRYELAQQATWAERYPHLSAYELAFLTNAENTILGSKRLHELSDQELADLTERTVEYRTFDWAHNNTCEVLPVNASGQEDPRFRAGNILFSYRQLDMIGVIDYPSGEIVWAWGPGEIEGQHMPTMLPNGHILIFDNGWYRGWSRLVEIDPLTEEIVWEFAGTPKENFVSPFISGAHLLPNGNIFICAGVRKHLFEVTREGEIVWEYWDPHGGPGTSRIYRATRYSPEFVGPVLDG